LHKLFHQRLGWVYGPWGYFGCRACDEEWLDEHPEDRADYDIERRRLASRRERVAQS
jgi:hypothetical protein